jgi:multidrug efflux pump subunit AcrA (membrane-fusion protein)
MTDCFTVAQPLIFSGVGIHSGRPSQIVLKPKQTAGCVFVHSVSKQTLAIAPQNLLEMDRGTCLQNKGMKVFTIEHLLCALYAHQIFAVEIEINSEEIPIFDGSAKKYFDDLKNIKKQKISAALDSLKIKKEIRLEKNRSYLLAKPADHFEIDANIPEADIAKLKIGADANITFDAYGSDVVFKAKLITIDPAETIIDGVATYKSTFQFVDNDERIKSGMTASLTITGDRRDDVLRVPQRSVITKNGKKFVQVLEGETIVDKAVETGLRGSDGMIEILSGISEGENVVVFNQSK